MKRIIAPFCLIVALASLSFSALAVGLGNIHLHSALGQPLDATIDLVDVQSASGLTVKLASPEQFSRANVRRTSMLLSLDFEVEEGVSGYHVHVTSDRPVKEPFLTFLIVANWSSGQMIREYTVLLSPPNYSVSGGSVAAPSQGTVATSSTNDTSLATTSSQRAQSGSQPASAHTGGAIGPEPDVAVTTAPAQPVNAPSGFAMPRGGSYGEIQKGETLWGIAHDLTSGDPVVVDQ